MPKLKERHYDKQPAPAEDVKVCTICRFQPETCGHDTDIKDRVFLRSSCVWCCDWQPLELTNEEVMEMNDRELVVFLSEDSLWQMMAKGIKTWDAQINVLTDERILRLTRGHWEKNHMSGRMPSYLPDETFVCFENILTGQILQFRFRGLVYARFAPGWCFIELSGLVATYDKDGGEIIK